MPRPPFLLLAHHRSGSNLVNDLLQAHPGIECLNEPLSMHTRYFRDCDLAHWGPEDFDAEVLHPALAADPGLRDYLLDLRAFLLQSSDRRVIGFKETVLFGKLGWLKAFMPGLKILFLQRDIRAVVSSVLRSGLMDELWQYGQRVPPAFAALHPGYRRRATTHESAAAELAAMSVVLRYELAHRELGLFEHRVLQFGQLMRDPAGSLAEVAAFLGVPEDAGPLEFLNGRQGETRGGLFSSFRARDEVQSGWRRHLTPKQVQAIEEVALACRGRIGEVVHE
jgi:hypothetical protein